MQKLADGQDTEVTSSLAWLWSRCTAAPHAPDDAAPECAVAGWPAAGELAPGLGGAGDPLHPVAAPVSRTAMQANISHSRRLPEVFWLGFQRPITGFSVLR